MFVCPIHLYIPQGCTHPPYVPILLCASVCSQRLLHVVGVVRGPLHVGHFPYIPLYGGASPSVACPTKLLASLCISIFQGYWYVIWGFFPSVGVWGVPHLLGMLGGISTWDVHMLILVHFCSSLCLTFLLQLWLLLLMLWWYLLACHWFHQWPWLLPWQDFQ